jgi:MFS family permease
MTEQKNSLVRDFFIFLWHGAFLTLTMSMIDFNTVFPALVIKLSDSKMIFGMIYSVTLGVPFLFNIIFSHFLSSKTYKKKYLIISIYLRALSFLGIAFSIFFFGSSNPMLTVYSFFIWIFLFSISGGMAGIVYLDIIGKLFIKDHRKKLFTYKQFVNSIVALIGGFAIKNILDKTTISFPLNYTIIFFIAFSGLVIASIAFWMIKEPESEVFNSESLLSYIKKVPQIIKADKSFLKYIFIQNATGISLMAMPFYMVYAKEILKIDNSYIGQYLIFQIAGTILSSFFWGKINQKWNSKIVVRTCIFLGAVLPVITLIAINFGPMVYSLVFFILGFLISGRRIGFDQYLLAIAPSDNRATYIGIAGTLNIFMVVFPLIGGIMVQFLGFTVMFTTVTIIMFTSYWVMRK